jgi:hypothetical protein
LLFTVARSWWLTCSRRWWDLVDRLAARRIPRTLSLAVVYVLLLGLVITGAGIMVKSHRGMRPEAERAPLGCASIWEEL